MTSKMDVYSPDELKEAGQIHSEPYVAGAARHSSASNQSTCLYPDTKLKIVYINRRYMEQRYKSKISLMRKYLKKLNTKEERRCIAFDNHMEIPRIALDLLQSTITLQK